MQINEATFFPLFWFDFYITIYCYLLLRRLFCIHILIYIYTYYILTYKPQQQKQQQHKQQQCDCKQILLPYFF